MRNISIINACTDLGVNVDGAATGPQILTNELKANNISNNYLVKKDDKKETVDFKNSSTNKETIDDFVKEFNSLLLQMHEAHFEQDMYNEQINLYNKKMQNLVLAVKALDSKCEKRNLTAIDEFNKELYQIVYGCLVKNEFPLTVGGDHIIAIASTLASIKHYKNLGLIWFDSHGDFNTYPTSVTGNLHGLPLAVATHYEKSILAPFHDGPFYNPKNTVIVGGRDIDPWEWGNIIDAGVTVFSTKDINEQGVQAICKKAFEIASNGTNGVHISFDLDLIDPEVAPGVSVPAANGINLEQTYSLVDEIVKYANIIKSADLVEFNPKFDKDHRTENIAKNILSKWIQCF